MIRRGNNYQRLLAAAWSGREESGFQNRSSPKGLDEGKTSGKPAEELTPTARSIQGSPIQRALAGYLIFDQFERAFHFWEQFAEQQVFIETIPKGLRSELPVSWFFDPMKIPSHLFEFETRPSQAASQKRLRVERMTWKRLKNASSGRGAYESSKHQHQSRRRRCRGQKSIFHKIKREEKKSLTIQLPFLQVFLDKLYLTIHWRQKTREARWVYAGQSEWNGEDWRYFKQFSRKEQSGGYFEGNWTKKDRI